MASGQETAGFWACTSTVRQLRYSLTCFPAAQQCGTPINRHLNNNRCVVLCKPRWSLPNLPDSTTWLMLLCSIYYM